jgi:hypothetical protein
MGVMEIQAVWEGAENFLEIPEALFRDFSSGLCRVLKYMGSKNIYSLNLAVYGEFEDQASFTTFTKVIPRIDLPPLKISEINYFERLHHEMLSFYLPEEICAEIRTFF